MGWGECLINGMSSEFMGRDERHKLRRVGRRMLSCGVREADDRRRASVVGREVGGWGSRQIIDLYEPVPAAHASYH